jgi:hypothetical protein
MENKNLISIETFETLAREVYKASQLRKQLEAREKELMSKLTSLTNHTPFKGNLFKLHEITRPGSVDYSAIPFFKSIDLSLYRKPDISYFKLEKIDVESEKIIDSLLKDLI